MLQTGSILKVVDNTGAKTISCIKISAGYKRRYAYLGDVVLVSIKTLRSKRRNDVKIKKGDIYKAIIVRTKTRVFSFSGDNKLYFSIPCAVLLTKQNKILGTRIFGSISKNFRFSKYLKLISLADGISS
jgi:large subunit ribosomal protein L14